MIGVPIFVAALLLAGYALRTAVEDRRALRLAERERDQFAAAYISALTRTEHNVVVPFPKQRRAK